jgi:8-oxo-dGTP pyrophosphatase MutT (NUDIX family)
MKRYKDASYPPHGKWDRRLTEIACPDLKPVELLHENEWFALRNRGGYYTMEYHLQQVIVLPIVGGSDIVMVRAKRPVLGDSTLELPAGCAEDGEAPEAGAARELAEEAGIAIDARRMVPMPPLAGSPNRIPYLLYVFRADLTREEWERRGPHDAEVEGVELVPLKSIPGLIERGALYVAVPIAVISTYLLNRTRV